jgi:hypothetical protein
MACKIIENNEYVKDMKDDCHDLFPFRNTMENRIAGNLFLARKLSQ